MFGIIDHAPGAGGPQSARDGEASNRWRLLSAILRGRRLESLAVHIGGEMADLEVSKLSPK
jgi:hypothetical protein